MKFKLEHKDSETKARACKIETDHGVIQTPIFMPVGTAASVKGVDQMVLKNEINQKNVIHDKVCFQSGNLDDKKGKLEFALQFNRDKIKFNKAFCNTVYNMNGGTHDAGFRSGIAKSIRKFAKNKNNKIKKI